MQQQPSFECALITGGKSGLGKGLASFLQNQGIRVIAVSSSDYDLRSPDQLEKLLILIDQETPDLIINNAGLGYYGPALGHQISDQMDIIKVNIEALTKITLHGARAMRKVNKSGTILNISSAAAFLPFPTFSIYAASKAYVNQFSLGLDQELKDQGIRILCACPGQIATDFRNRAAKGHPQKSDRRTMTIEQAVSHLWKQIQMGKTLSVFDWRTHLLILFSKCFPRNLLGKFLQKSISDRHSQREK